MSRVDFIVDWLRRKVTEAGRKGIAVGLSGGVDSSVVAVLSKKAVGKNMVGVIMPCESNPLDAEHALLVAREFGIDTEYVDLGPVFHALGEALPEGSPLARANIKPRLRMLTLYYIANTRDYLVAGTGNRTEIAVGYFTKYGDGGVDILPIGGLLKVEVRETARELGIPAEIIDKPPSAGLWEGQTDEGEMGITYEELDRIIARAEKPGFVPRTKTEKTVAAMMEKARHKQELPPVCPVPEEGPETVG